MSDNADLSFMDIDLDSAIEYSILPDGEEVEVVIVDVNPMPEHKLVQVRLQIVDHPHTKNLRHPVFYPKDSDDDRQKNDAILRVKKFVQAFGLSSAQINEDAIGKRAWVVLGIKEDKSGQYGDENRIKAFSTPK